MSEQHTDHQRCPMCSYAPTLPPLRMAPLRALVAKVRQMELASGGYICESPDEVSLGDPDFERYFPLTDLNHKLVVIHKLCQLILDRAAPSADFRRKEDLVLVPMTELEAQAFRSWQKVSQGG